jgi:hypothetical protein
MRDVIVPRDDEDIAPNKKFKENDVYKKKAEELERKLAALHKNKTVQKNIPPVTTGKSMFANAFS